MPLSIAILMDPIQTIQPAKDTSLALLLEAQQRGHAIFYMQPGDLAMHHNIPMARLAPLEVRDDLDDYFDLGQPAWRKLHDMDVVFARRDPPVDTQFLYDTMVLEMAQKTGVQVVNAPQALRDCNEKLFALQFPQCIAPTLVSRHPEALRDFVAQHGEVVCKPLDGMGGRGIFRIKRGDNNLNSILETLLGEQCHGEPSFVMAQPFIQEISAGDKRILLIDGEPIPYALARIPQVGEFRGNLAAGGHGVSVKLSERDRWITTQVAPELCRRGIRFAGLDVIGEFLTEINITSPTCVRELDAQCGLNIAGILFDAIEHTPV